jgi:hypothetical protein
MKEICIRYQMYSCVLTVYYTIHRYWDSKKINQLLLDSVFKLSRYNYMAFNFFLNGFDACDRSSNQFNKWSKISSIKM